MKLIPAVCFVMFLVVPLPSSAHPQTERYIPIGSSPGSDYVVRGKITSVDGANLMVSGKNIVVGAATPVWIDRSGQNRSNQIGQHSDCAPGQYVEIRYRETDGGYQAEWVKVRG